jgi:hypothetical protein
MQKITFNLTFPSGKQQIIKLPILEAIEIGTEPVYIDDTLYNVSTYDKKTLQDYINNLWKKLQRREGHLNGDMANQFNEMDI